MDDEILLTPPRIKEQLDRDIVGQEEIKKTLAMLSYYYMQEVQEGTIAGSKTNALIIGDTGVGKTAVIKSLAKILKMPYAVGDASSLTTAGFKGNNIDSIFEPFLKYNGRYPGNKIPGIVFIDEIDKMVSKNNNNVTNNLQNEFLKIIEGGEVHLETSPYKGVGRVTIDTSKMMFIFAGSFPKLREIIQARLENAPEGKKVVPEQIIKEVKHEDLENFGISREFLGRISTVKAMDSMSAEMLKRIFTTPQNSILNQYREKLKKLGIELNFTSEAIDYIVAQALKNNTGARGLAGITQEIMDNVLYKVPEEENVLAIKVTLSAAQNKAPEIIYNSPEKLRQRALEETGAEAGEATPGSYQIKTQLIWGQVQIKDLLVSADQAEKSLEKYNQLLVENEKINNSFWRSNFQGERKIELRGKLRDHYHELRDLSERIKFVQKDLSQTTRTLAALDINLPTVQCDWQTYKMNGQEDLSLPKLPLLLETALRYKNKLDEIIGKENRKIINSQIDGIFGKGKNQESDNTGRQIKPRRESTYSGDNSASL